MSEATSETDHTQRHNYVIDRTRNVIQKALLGTPEDKPFFFVFGPINVHRPYLADSGQNLWGLNPNDLKGLIPKFLPDVDDVRRDFADYLGEVLALDLMLGVMLEELENTDQKPTYAELHNQTAVTTTDLDASLTKAYLFNNQDHHFELTLAKRPLEELYDIKADPDQLENLAENPEMQSVLKTLRHQIDSVMLTTSDPRLTDSFDYLPYSDPTKPAVRTRR